MTCQEAVKAAERKETAGIRTTTKGYSIPPAPTPQTLAQTLQPCYCPRLWVRQGYECPQWKHPKIASQIPSDAMIFRPYRQPATPKTTSLGRRDQIWRALPPMPRNCVCGICLIPQRCPAMVVQARNPAAIRPKEVFVGLWTHTRWIAWPIERQPAAVSYTHLTLPTIE